MLSVERIKELLNDPAISDEEAEKIRDETRRLAELIFDSWMEDRKKAKMALSNANDKENAKTE